MLAMGKSSKPKPTKPLPFCGEISEPYLWDASPASSPSESPRTSGAKASPRSSAEPSPARTNSPR